MLLKSATLIYFIFTFKQALGVLLIQSEQLSGSFTNLGQGELDPPHLTLVPHSILAWKNRIETVKTQAQCSLIHNRDKGGLTTFCLKYYILL